ELQLKKYNLEQKRFDQIIQSSTEYRQLAELERCGILTNNEFIEKVEILKNIKSKPTPSIKVEEVTPVFEVWHKLTNYHQNIGKYITLEIISPEKEISGFEVNKKTEEDIYFLINDLDFGYFSSIEDLILQKFNI